MYQKQINSNTANDSHIQFAYLKATEGAYFVDITFRENWRKIEKKGCQKGAYHFYHADANPERQAILFLNTIRKVRKNILPPMLDLQNSPCKITPEQYLKNLFTWLHLVEDSLGTTPVIYTTVSFANIYLTDERLSKHPLCIASYGIRPPILPKVWTNAGWSFWQYGVDTITKITLKSGNYSI